MSERELKVVREVLELVERHGLSQMEWEADGVKIVVSADTVAESAPVEAAPPDYSEMENVRLLTAPLTGTFYRSATPDTPPFIEVGQSVEKGDTIGVLEAMKVFNEVPAEIGGTVLNIPAQSGTLIQRGDPLVVLQEDAA